MTHEEEKNCEAIVNVHIGAVKGISNTNFGWTGNPGAKLATTGLPSKNGGIY